MREKLTFTSQEKLAYAGIRTPDPGARRFLRIPTRLTRRPQIGESNIKTKPVMQPIQQTYISTDKPVIEAMFVSCTKRYTWLTLEDKSVIKAVYTYVHAHKYVPSKQCCFVSCTYTSTSPIPPRAWPAAFKFFPAGKAPRKSTQDTPTHPQHMFKAQILRGSNYVCVCKPCSIQCLFFFFQAEDGIRDRDG